MKWSIKKGNLINQIKMSRNLGISRPMASVLLNRGIAQAEAELLLDNPVALIEDPKNMYGVEDAANAIYQAIQEKRNFYVYADYDVDGMTSGTLLHDFFKAAGVKASIAFPERVDGYGITIEYAKAIIEQAKEPSIVITVDNGITAVEPIRLLQEAGIPVVILDHHEPGAIIPEAIICDPWMDCRQGTHLCGCGVAWKVCMMVEHMMDADLGIEQMLPLVALGTVADVMPMTIENRAIVTMGLAMINKREHKGIAKLMTACDIKKLTAKDIAWTIGPNLNACSRMGDTLTGAKVLLESNPDTEAVLRYNRQRKNLTDDAIKEAKEVIGEACALPVITFDSSAYPAGIMGIIAGKLAEEYGRPAAVYQQEEGGDHCHASCRSVPGISIKDIINHAAFSGYTEGAAGHAEACGAVLLKSKLDLFEMDAAQYIQECLASAVEADAEPTLDIDSEIALDELTPGLIAELNLVPFSGSGDEPLFCTEEVVVEPMTPFKNKEHLVLRMMDSNGKIGYALKWYGMADYMELGSPERLRVAGTPAPAKFAAKSLGLNYSDAIIDLKYMEAC